MPREQAMEPDRRLLEEERDLLLGTLRLVGATGGKENAGTDRLFLLLGINTYRLSLDGPLPDHVRKQVTDGIETIRAWHRVAIAERGGST